jgi:hypothetical protein
VQPPAMHARLHPSTTRHIRCLSVWRVLDNRGVEMLMFSRTQLYISAALLGIVELVIMIVRTVGH